MFSVRNAILRKKVTDSGIKSHTKGLEKNCTFLGTSNCTSVMKENLVAFLQIHHAVMVSSHAGSRMMV